jgi:hypothetical protein
MSAIWHRPDLARDVSVDQNDLVGRTSLERITSGIHLDAEWRRCKQKGSGLDLPRKREIQIILEVGVGTLEERSQ